MIAQCWNPQQQDQEQFCFATVRRLDHLFFGKGENLSGVRSEATDLKIPMRPSAMPPRSVTFCGQAKENETEG